MTIRHARTRNRHVRDNRQILRLEHLVLETHDRRVALHHIGDAVEGILLRQPRAVSLRIGNNRIAKLQLRFLVVAVLVSHIHHHRARAGISLLSPSGKRCGSIARIHIAGNAHQSHGFKRVGRRSIRSGRDVIIRPTNACDIAVNIGVGGVTLVASLRRQRIHRGLQVIEGHPRTRAIGSNVVILNQDIRSARVGLIGAIDACGHRSRIAQVNGVTRRGIGHNRVGEGRTACIQRGKLRRVRQLEVGCALRVTLIVSHAREGNRHHHVSRMARRVLDVRHRKLHGVAVFVGGSTALQLRVGSRYAHIAVVVVGTTRRHISAVTVEVRRAGYARAKLRLRVVARGNIRLTDKSYAIKTQVIYVSELPQTGRAHAGCRSRRAHNRRLARILRHLMLHVAMQRGCGCLERGRQLFAAVRRRISLLAERLAIRSVICCSIGLQLVRHLRDDANPHTRALLDLRIGIANAKQQNAVLPIRLHKRAVILNLAVIGLRVGLTTQRSRRIGKLRRHIMARRVQSRPRNRTRIGVGGSNLSHLPSHNALTLLHFEAGIHVLKRNSRAGLGSHIQVVIHVIARVQSAIGNVIARGGRGRVKRFGRHDVAVVVIVGKDALKLGIGVKLHLATALKMHLHQTRKVAQRMRDLAVGGIIGLQRALVRVLRLQGIAINAHRVRAGSGRKVVSCLAERGRGSLIPLARRQIRVRSLANAVRTVRVVAALAVNVYALVGKRIAGGSPISCKVLLRVEHRRGILAVSVRRVVGKRHAGDARVRIRKVHVGIIGEACDGVRLAQGLVGRGKPRNRDHA